MAGIGVLTGMFIIFGATSSLDYKLSFSISGGFCLIVAFYLLFAISDIHYERKTEIHLPIR
jgi:hypothetical protein